jgi:hypothetical protein
MPYQRQTPVTMSEAYEVRLSSQIEICNPLFLQPMPRLFPCLQLLALLNRIWLGPLSADD